ncbi:MAG: acyl-CoA reductase [Nitrospirota bacterium]
MNEAIDQIADRLFVAQRLLHEKPIFEIIGAIDQVSKIFLDPSHPLCQEAVAHLSRHFSMEMAKFAIADCFQNLTAPKLKELLEEEFYDPLMLDTFRPRRSGVGKTRAFGPRLITHILPGNIPSIGVMSLVTAILVKSASIAKISAQNGDLTPFFIEGLHTISPLLAKSIAIVSWEQSNQKEMSAAFSQSDKVILYGSDETVDAIAKLVSPLTKMIVHGSKVSLGLIAKECVSREIAERAAMDVALYDQRGCLSPHLYYVEEGGGNAPILFAQYLSEALQKMPLPKGPISNDSASAIQQLRGTMQLMGGMVFASSNTVDYTVLYDPDPAFAFSPLSRTIWIKPIKTFSEIGNHLSAIGNKLQAVGIALPESSCGKRESILEMLGLMGACRICPIGEMQKPPLTWHHDGRFRILDLLQFVDLEGLRTA